jgi:hypothetical protein
MTIPVLFGFYAVGFIVALGFFNDEEACFYQAIFWPVVLLYVILYYAIIQPLFRLGVGIRKLI